MSKLVRPPAVSGAFYPQDKRHLSSIVERLIEAAPRAEFEGHIRMVIAPHAGYEYSGPVAAAAYRQLTGVKYRRVILIGPSHQNYFAGAVIDAERDWATPLGELALDREGVKRLVAQEKKIAARPELFDVEHSLEVQLPFLQKVLVGSSFIPIMLGDQTYRTCKMVGDAMAAAFKGEDVLIIASTDLYHGPSYDECVATDRFTIKQIEAFDPAGLALLLEQKKAQACGGGAVVAGQIGAAQLGGRKVMTLKYANSSDITGTRGAYVVGYVAALVLNSPAYTQEEERAMTAMARAALEKLLNGEALPKFVPQSNRLKESSGVFVTLKSRGQLRGCIGYVEGRKPLYQAIPAMAAAAAFEDPRFPPLAKNELAGLKIEVTILSPLHKVKDFDEIEVGRHGILVKSGFNQGLLLPQVAAEENWDRKAFLKHACLKAGLDPDDFRKESVEVYTFEGAVICEQPRPDV